MKFYINKKGLKELDREVIDTLLSIAKTGVKNISIEGANGLVKLKYLDSVVNVCCWCKCNGNVSISNFDDNSISMVYV